MDFHAADIVTLLARELATLGLAVAILVDAVLALWVAFL